jgi:MoaA/NifB/PqqE/SkfB family radical SAM enzyme
LNVETLLRAITDASAEGYDVVGFSGGEPLLYEPLRELLDRARQHGMLTSVTSNGMLLDAARLEWLGGAVDLLAISLDGPPESHNRMRASERAFETMAGRLEGVRKSGIPFGFIFTLTQHNVHELEWVAQFALEQGARLLQIHPLELAGRAQQLLSESRPDEIETAYAYIEALRVQASVRERLHIQVDLVSRDALRAHPARVFAGDAKTGEEADRLADLVAPLIIEADGTVVPLQYGFPRAHALGNLKDASLRELAAGWRRERYAAFHALCRRTFEEITAPADYPLVNWYEVVARGDSVASHA